MEPKQACNKYLKLSLIVNAAQLAQAVNELRCKQGLFRSRIVRRHVNQRFFFRYPSSSFKNIGPFPRTRAVDAAKINRFQVRI